MIVVKEENCVMKSGRNAFVYGAEYQNRLPLRNSITRWSNILTTKQIRPSCGRICLVKNKFDRVLVEFNGNYTFYRLQNYLSSGCILRNKSIHPLKDSFAIDEM